MAADLASGVTAVVEFGEVAVESLATHAEWITAAFQPNGLRFTPAYLRWVASNPAGSRACVIRMTSRDQTIGLLAAVPRAFVYAGVRLVGHVVSFVAVHPEHRGKGVSSDLYSAIVESIRGETAGVLVWGRAGSAGERAFRRGFATAGWQESQLGTQRGWASLLGRLRSDGPPTGTAAVDSPSSLTDELGSYASADPRLVHLTGAGTRLLREELMTPNGPQPYFVVEGLPEHGDAALLRHELELLHDTVSPPARQLLLPSVPYWVESAAPALGLRRIPGVAYVPWWYTPDTIAERPSWTSCAVV